METDLYQVHKLDSYCNCLYLQLRKRAAWSQITVQQIALEISHFRTVSSVDVFSQIQVISSDPLELAVTKVFAASTDWWDLRPKHQQSEVEDGYIRRPEHLKMMMVSLVSLKSWSETFRWECCQLPGLWLELEGLGCITTFVDSEAAVLYNGRHTCRVRVISQVCGTDMVLSLLADPLRKLPIQFGTRSCWSTTGGRTAGVWTWEITRDVWEPRTEKSNSPGVGTDLEAWAVTAVLRDVLILRCAGWTPGVSGESASLGSLGPSTFVSWRSKSSQGTAQSDFTGQKWMRYYYYRYPCVLLGPVRFRNSCILALAVSNMSKLFCSLSLRAM